MAGRRSRGVIYLIIGFLLLFIAGGWYVHNLLEDRNAGAQSEEILNQMENRQEDLSGAVSEEEEFCGRVTISRLDIELPVYDEWSYTRLKTAPCRYTGSIETEDMIIAAHNYSSHFGSLNRLEAGDQVSFTDTRGRVHLYEVREIVTLDGTAVSDMQSGEWDFTLFTCTKGGKQRVTVRCEKKQEEKSI